jgi:hypothetical protein
LAPGPAPHSEPVSMETKRRARDFLEPEHFGVKPAGQQQRNTCGHHCPIIDTLNGMVGADEQIGPCVVQVCRLNVFDCEAAATAPPQTARLHLQILSGSWQPIAKWLIPWICIGGAHVASSAVNDGFSTPTCMAQRAWCTACSVVLGMLRSAELCAKTLRAVVAGKPAARGCCMAASQRLCAGVPASSRCPGTLGAKHAT